MASDELLAHWQGQRRVTRRVIAAFPGDDFFTFSIGGMRPFAAMVHELIGIADAGIEGLVTRQWHDTGGLMHHAGKAFPETKQGVLQLWDDTTKKIDNLWLSIPANRMNEIDKVFGAYEGPVYGSFLYWVDNEIHHRGQGYVYLRALSVEPPPFYERE